MMVQHNTNPIPKNPNPNGTERNSHKHADNNAPVNLKPIQSTNVKIPKPNKKPNILFSLLSLSFSNNFFESHPMNC